MRLLVLILTLCGGLLAQTAITSVTEKSMNTNARTKINANFASILANAPNGKAALTTVNGLVYITSAGTLGSASMLTRTGAGLFQLYDTTAASGISTLTLRAGAGQTTTPMLQWKNNGGTNVGAVNGDGSVTVPYLVFVTGTEPTCNSGARSRIYVVEGGTGVADTVRMCVKSAADNYAWTSIIYNP